MLIQELGAPGLAFGWPNLGGACSEGKSIHHTLLKSYSPQIPSKSKDAIRYCLKSALMENGGKRRKIASTPRDRSAFRCNTDAVKRRWLIVGWFLAVFVWKFTGTPPDPERGPVYRSLVAVSQMTSPAMLLVLAAGIFVIWKQPWKRKPLAER